MRLRRTPDRSDQTAQMRKVRVLTMNISPGPESLARTEPNHTWVSAGLKSILILGDWNLIYREYDFVKRINLKVCTFKCLLRRLILSDCLQ